MLDRDSVAADGAFVETRVTAEFDASGRELVARAKSGDRAAFARLWESHRGAVHGIVLAHGPRGEVQDLVQDVFVLALRSIATLEDAERFPGWLASIARNAALDARKRVRHASEFVDEPIARADAPRDDEEEAERALSAVRELPEAFRETLILRLVEGLSGPEIAARTGMTHGSVRVNLTRGMKLLRERLERKAVR